MVAVKLASRLSAAASFVCGGAGDVGAESGAAGYVGVGGGEGTGLEFC